MKEQKKSIENVDAVLSVMEPEAAQEPERRSEGGQKKGQAKRRSVRELVSGGIVHGVMVAAILAGVRWQVEVPVLIGLGIWHTGACAVALDRAWGRQA